MPAVIRVFRHLLPTIAVAFAIISQPADGMAQSRSAAEIFKAIVGIRAEVPLDARTARSLGTEREGSGVVIEAPNLVLTIGYLILEASAVGIVAPDGQIVRSEIIAYDHETGFGLLRADRPLGVEPLRLGDSTDLAAGAPVLAVSAAGPQPITPARVVDRRTFAGYWEYLLENAIFTAPPQPYFGGAALLGGDGQLLGIGSLMVNDAVVGANEAPGNMFVPIDALKPILADLIARGRSASKPHPWLGVYTAESEGRIFVTRTATGGPGETAGVKPGDVIIGVGGIPVRDMADFLRKVWSRGDAGAVVPLDIMRSDDDSDTVVRVEVRSGNRYDWLKLSGRL